MTNRRPFNESDAEYKHNDNNGSGSRFTLIFNLNFDFIFTKKGKRERCPLSPSIWNKKKSRDDD